jgi:hypothetical protein
VKRAHDKYVALMDRFLGFTMSAEDFRDAYLTSFKNEKERFGEPMFALLDEQFGNLDAFTRDSELLQESPGNYLDEPTLRAKTRDVLRRIVNLDNQPHTVSGDTTNVGAHLLEVGYAFDTPVGRRDMALEALSEAPIFSVRPRRLATLSGPNDTLQLIGDIEAWKAIAVGIAVVFGTGFFNEAGKDAWKNRVAIARKTKEILTSPISKLLAPFAGTANHKEASATICIVSDSSHRMPGIDVAVSDPAEVAWRMNVMAHHAQAIKETIEKIVQEGGNPGFIQNPDMRTIAVIPLDNGDVTLEWTVEAPKAGAPNAAKDRTTRKITLKW